AGAILLFFIVIGMQKFVAAWLAGPIADALYSISAVFSTVLALDLVAMAIIWSIEHILERVTGHKVQYAPALAAGGRATAALSSGIGPKSVFDLRLPIPPAPGKEVKSGSAKLPAGGEKPAKPAFKKAPEAPAALSRPGFNPAPKPGSAAPAASGTGSSTSGGTTSSPGGAFGQRPAASGTSNQPGNQPARPGGTTSAP